MPKVYTKNGDNGKTSLYDGSCVEKTAKFLDVLGEIDELSSRIGMLCAQIPTRVSGQGCVDKINFKFPLNQCSDKEQNNPINILRLIQSKLQDLNSVVAIVNKVNRKIPTIEETDVTTLEKYIDHMEEFNPILTKFILSGVTSADAQAHLCRTQTRKVERCLWELNNSKEYVKDGYTGEYIDLADINFAPYIFKYINRLSDFFFVFARWLCAKQRFEDCVKL